ncbi:MAG: zinc ABC transporter solute-binding protein [Saprospiraceae bacterium]|nr:zinc ABC transporter solute-binding protein [Saprospiraceae bacterium]
MIKNPKQILILLALIPTICFAQKPKVVSSASMIWDMAKEIGGEHVEHQLIVPIGGDPHLYEPTPRDAQMIHDADLIFINALTFEGWILELIENSGTKATVDTVTNGVAAISSTTYKNSYDPHAWMDIQNGLIYIENIKNALTKLLPEHGATFQKNYEDYKARLEELDKYILDRIQEIPKEKRILITSHDAFEYYGKRYGLKLEAIMGISTEAEAQTSDIIRINKTIQSSKVPAVFIESTINPKLLEQIAKDNNIVIGGELYADSIGDEESHAPTYYAMLKHNTDVIVDALTLKNLPEEAKQSGPSNLLAYIGVGMLFIIGLLYMILKSNKNA